jgi:hypothetical protein
VPRLPSPVGRATMDRRSVPSPVCACPPRLPPYHDRDAIVPFVTKQAAVAYLRTLRQPRVCRRPCFPELAAGRHSRHHCGAPSCAPFHARPSCPHLPWSPPKLTQLPLATAVPPPRRNKCSQIPSQIHELRGFLPSDLMGEIHVNPSWFFCL